MCHSGSQWIFAQSFLFLQDQPSPSGDAGHGTNRALTRCDMQRPWARHALMTMLVILAAGVASSARGDPTDISTTPLSSSGSVNVLPNILFTLDESGRMGGESAPDSSTFYHCRNTFSTKHLRMCDIGDPPFHAAKYNTLAYDPAIGYRPGLNVDGTPMAIYSRLWNKASTDGFQAGAATIDLTSQYPELQWCNSSGTCKRNAIDTPTPLLYRIDFRVA